MSNATIEPEFDEPRDGKKRADIVAEDMGGLPKDNPFTEVVEDLLDDNESWQETFDKLHEVFKIVDEASAEEMCELLPEWRVAVVVPDQNSTSGERYEYYEFSAETAEKAEQWAESRSGWPVESSKTEQTGVSKVF